MEKSETSHENSKAVSPWSFVPVADGCLAWGSALSAFSVVASYLVDPSSSHMLVSKIKPCMSKYNPLEGETAKGSLNHT